MELSNLETVKDLIAESKIPDEIQIRIQSLLSELRTEILLLERRFVEARLSQDIYSSVCNKIIDRLLDK